MKKFKFAFGISLALFAAATVFVSCQKNKPVVADTPQQAPNLPATPYGYSEKHGVNSHLATLGRVLFYDRVMSVNNAVACGSCHKQANAFADNVRFNKGFNGIDLKRNSPSIQGITGFFNKFIFDDPNTTQASDGMPDATNQQQVLLFWDGRQRSLGDMVLNPVLNHNEMSTPDFATLVKKLGEKPYYADLFKNAYGSADITKEKIAYALEGFISCLNSTVTGQSNVNVNNNGNNNNNGNPPVIGEGPSGGPVTNPTNMEEMGKFLFHNKYNCAQCHDPSNTGSYGTVTQPSQMFNIGLDEVYADQGLGAITRKAGDNGLFKVPTLKNISVTAPYMHDGRFATLSDVLDHYSHNIKANDNLTPLFLSTDGTPKKLNILPAEKQALIAFLNTLKDDDFLTSPMYSDPFNY